MATEQKGIKSHVQNLLKLRKGTGMVDVKFMGLQRNKCETEIMAKDDLTRQRQLCLHGASCTVCEINTFKKSCWQASGWYVAL